MKATDDRLMPALLVRTAHDVRIEGSHNNQLYRKRRRQATALSTAACGMPQFGDSDDQIGQAVAGSPTRRPVGRRSAP
jgi:hypothetical protein